MRGSSLCADPVSSQYSQQSRVLVYVRTPPALPTREASPLSAQHVPAARIHKRRRQEAQRLSPGAHTRRGPLSPRPRGGKALRGACYVWHRRRRRGRLPPSHEEWMGSGRSAPRSGRIGRGCDRLHGDLSRGARRRPPRERLHEGADGGEVALGVILDDIIVTGAADDIRIALELRRAALVQLHRVVAVDRRVGGAVDKEHCGRGEVGGVGWGGVGGKEILKF